MFGCYSSAELCFLGFILPGIHILKAESPLPVSLHKCSVQTVGAKKHQYGGEGGSSSQRFLLYICMQKGTICI